MKKKLLLLALGLVFSACEAVFVENISDQIITVISPTDNSELNATEVTFSWNEIEDAESYRLRVVAPNFENTEKIELDTIISKSLFVKELTSGDYEWSIIGQNFEYQTQETISSFKLNN